MLRFTAEAWSASSRILLVVDVSSVHSALFAPSHDRILIHAFPVVDPFIHHFVVRFRRDDHKEH